MALPDSSGDHRLEGCNRLDAVTPVAYLVTLQFFTLPAADALNRDPAR
jgi:hypothetical protein